MSRWFMAELGTQYSYAASSDGEHEAYDDCNVPFRVVDRLSGAEHYVGKFHPESTDNDLREILRAAVLLRIQRLGEGPSQSTLLLSIVGLALEFEQGEQRKTFAGLNEEILRSFDWARSTLEVILAELHLDNAQAEAIRQKLNRGRGPNNDLPGH